MTVGDSIQVRSGVLGRRTGTVIAVNMEHHNYTVAIALPGGTVRESFWICRRDLVAEPDPVAEYAASYTEATQKKAALRETALQNKKREVVQLYRLGQNFKQIAEHYHVHEYTARRWYAEAVQEGIA